MKAWIEANGRGMADIQPGKSGQFDLVIGGKLVYSRYETGRFPSAADLQNIDFPAGA